MPDAGGDVYADYVKSLLDAETARKSSFESRGLSVITSSGTLVTLLFALVAAVTAAKNFNLPTTARYWLLAAIIAFSVAVLLGIFVNMPLLYNGGVVTTSDVAAGISDGPVTAEAKVMVSRIALIDSARRENNFKGWMLVAATGAELVAVALLAVGVASILLGNPHPSNS